MSGMKKAAVSGYCSDPNDQSNVYIDKQEQQRNRRKRVIRAEKWQCPLENEWKWLNLIGIGHQGVVVTLEDHKTRYVVHKLPAVNEESAGVGEVVIAYASKMGSNWSQFDQKAVKNAELSDYLHACGYNYDKLKDNCWHAVDRMWALN